ncbi:MAG: phage head closure protein [Psychrobacter sp.]|nr:phage head closure protein [Psychrobacter sp.]
MTLRAGDLRHRVTIERYETGGRDDDGFDLPSPWVLFKKAWAQITYLSSKDMLAAKASQSEVVARMKLRYKAAQGIDTTMRVLYKGRVLAIDSQALDDNEDGMTYTTFNLSQGVETFKD